MVLEGNSINNMHLNVNKINYYKNHISEIKFIHDVVFPRLLVASKDGNQVINIHFKYEHTYICAKDTIYNFAIM